MKAFFGQFLFFFWLCASPAGATMLDTSPQKVIKDIDYLYMHSSLPMSYKLPSEFKKEKLKFSGNYKTYTKASYRPAQNDILFTPIKNGSAIMVIKNGKNKILTRISLSIQKDNLHKIAAELRDLLVAVDGIEIKIYNNKVIIDGQVMLPAEMDRIAKVVSDYTPKVRSFVSYSPQAQKKIAELIESEIEYPEVEVKYAYNRFLLQGCVNSGEEKRRALSIANLYTQFDVNPVGVGAQKRNIPILRDDLKVPCESVKKNRKEDSKKNQIQKLIQVVVHFVQINKSFNKAFLFQWTPTINTGGTNIAGSLSNRNRINYSDITATLTATVGNFFPKLNWAKTFDFARVLHNSSLLLEDGTGGTIATNTTVPGITLKDGSRQDGGTSARVSVNINPIIQGPSENMIRLKIDISVAAPSGSKRTTEQSINTTINVRDGSSAVIGGLSSAFLSQSFNGDRSPVSKPLLDLHSAKKYNSTKSQFVVFITPIIKSSASVGVDRIKEKFRINE